MPKPRILVVDDEKLARETVSRVLEDEFEVQTAASGLEAITWVKADRFDVVLLDVKMPKMSGLDALKEIKMISPTTEVIMVTALDQSDVAWQSSKGGAFDFVTKPFHNEMLLAKIREVLKNKAAKDVNGRKADLLAEIFTKSKQGGVLGRRMNYVSDLFSRRGYDLGSLSVEELEEIAQGRKDEKI